MLFGMLFASRGNSKQITQNFHPGWMKALTVPLYSEFNIIAGTKTESLNNKYFKLKNMTHYENALKRVWKTIVNANQQLQY